MSSPGSDQVPPDLGAETLPTALLRPVKWGENKWHERSDCKKFLMNFEKFKCGIFDHLSSCNIPSESISLTMSCY